MKNEKKQYTAPELTVVTFKVEHGYSASDPLFDGMLGLRESSNAGDGGQEVWAVDTYEGNWETGF